jgi:hypothetical protein
VRIITEKMRVRHLGITIRLGVKSVIMSKIRTRNFFSRSCVNIGVAGGYEDNRRGRI